MKIVSDGKSLEIPTCAAQDIYSTQEQVVGRWIDGKPLYRRTVITTTPPANNEVPIAAIDHAEFKETKGYFVSAVGGVMPLCFFGALDSYSVCYANGNDIFFEVSHRNYENRPCVITALYTKTTDPTTIELPAMLTVSRPLSTAAPQSAAAVELKADFFNEEV